MTEEKDKIIDHFINDVSLEGQAPKSIFAFCKAHELKEEDFYQYFSSFESLEKKVWIRLFTHVIEAVEGDPVFQEYNTRERYLAYCFTLIEQLKKNLSFYKISADDRTMIKAMSHPALKASKSADVFFKSLVKNGAENEEIQTPDLMVGQLSKLFHLNQIFIIKYFLKDESEGFQQTDQAIEKSARLLFDALENSLLSSIIDFSKFVGKGVFS